MLTSNYKFGEVFPLASQIEFTDDKVNFQDLFQNGNGGVCLLAFKEGQFLTPHQAPAEVMVTVLEGEVEFTINDRVLPVKAGDFLLLGEGMVHSVKAVKTSKVMLTKIKA